jgi:hypothetical protein
MRTIDRALCLRRNSFCERDLSSAELEALAGFFFAAFQLPQNPVPAGNSFYAVETAVWGFPRALGPALAEAITSASRAEGCLGFVTQLVNPDLISSTTGLREGQTRFPVGAFAQVFGRGRTDSYAFVFRLSVFRWPGEPRGTSLGGAVLTLMGQWRGDLLHVMSLWVSGPQQKAEDLFEWAPWDREQEFWSLFDQFRASGQVSPLAATVFETSAVERVAWFFVDALMPQPRENRWRCFLARVGALLFLTSASGGAAFVLPRWGMPWFVCIGLACLFGAGLANLLFRHGRLVARFYHQMTQQFRTIASLPVRHEVLNELPPEFAADILLPKYTNDLESLGWQFWHDIDVTYVTAFRSVNRAFLSPDGTTVFMLLLMKQSQSLQFFPSMPSFIATTYFSNGRRLVSVQQGSGFRKPLDDRVIHRLFPEATDPAMLIQRHEAVVRRLVAEGYTANSCRGINLADTLQEEHQQWLDQLRRHGYYTWAAAFRQEFELIHPAYREPQAS